mmetsp:Transcript_21343/g.54124  ORF Transcript_21343/g.54124 Transcript_21343/m.54124 type:complete len:93 (-) Transcript_21343:43-321(-)
MRAELLALLNLSARAPTRGSRLTGVAADADDSGDEELDAATDFDGLPYREQDSGEEDEDDSADADFEQPLVSDDEDDEADEGDLEGESMTPF